MLAMPPIDYDSAVHALKTGIAVVLASLLSICDPIYSFTATGGWAVVTVIVLSQRTVGATMLKFTERTLGTAAAAAAASICGLAVDRYLPDFWQPLAVASLLFVVTVYCIYRADTGSWTYAYTMTALTFNFLLLLCYRQPELAVHAARLLMIVIGGLTTLLVSVAPPQLTAHEKARTVLSESFEDAARAIRTVGAAVVSGRQLHRLSRVELAPAALDDEIHVAYRQVVLARTTIDEATKAAPWEAWLQPRRVDWARHKELGKRLRRTIYAVMSIDGFLRVDQPRHSPPSEAFRRTLAPRLLAATERMAAVLATFATAVKTLDDVEADRVAASAGLEAMEQSLALLRKGLREYVAAVSPEVAQVADSPPLQSQEAAAAAEDGATSVYPFATSVAVVRLLLNVGDGIGSVATAMRELHASRRPSSDVREARRRTLQAIAARRHPTTTAMV